MFGFYNGIPCAKHNELRNTRPPLAAFLRTEAVEAEHGNDNASVWMPWRSPRRSLQAGACFDGFCKKAWNRQVAAG